MDYTIVGSEVNLAERLEGMAELGTILISHETHCLTREHIEARELEPLSLKGFSKPVRNYQVVGTRDQTSQSSDAITVNLAGVDVSLDRRNMTEAERKASVRALRALISRIEQ